MSDVQQPVHGTPRDPRQFDTTQLRESTHGKYVHRDYLAHFFRWQFAKKMVKAGMRILDIGCGQDQPFPKLLTVSKSTVPAFYIGVDLNHLEQKFNSKWATIFGRFDFTTRWPELKAITEFDLITCFEVIEHMGTEDGAKLLAGARECLAPGGTFLLSTPVFSGVAARNHVHEYTVPELQAAIEASGLTVLRRMGTFGDVNVVRKALQPDEAAVWDRLSRFLCNDALACFMSALYPDSCKNNIWVLTK